MSNPLQRFLFITGFMGSGKTTLAKVLSKHYNCPLYDLDSEIELALDSDILNVFSIRGEAYFRIVESDILHKIVQHKPAGIVSTGGGAVISPLNRKLMRDNGLIVWLSVPPGEIIARLKVQSLQRPLAQKNGTLNLDRLLDMYRNRIPTYLQCHSHIYGVGSNERVLTRAIECIATLNNL